MGEILYLSTYVIIVKYSFINHSIICESELGGYSPTFLPLLTLAEDDIDGLSGAEVPHDPHPLPVLHTPGLIEFVSML